MSKKSMDQHQYDTVGRALEFIETRVEDQPGLAEVAQAVGMSPFQCQRLFSRMVGVSPKKFLQYLTLQRAKAALETASVLDASYDAGLSGPGRLHDLFVSVEAATPGEFKARGESMTIRHGVADSPFGPCLILSSERGITGLAFVEPAEEAEALDELSAPYAVARFVEDAGQAEALATRIFAPITGASVGEAGPLRLFLSGTPFQLKVWEALLRVPPGALVAYDDIAKRIRRPTAARAVGGAIGANLIAYLIPCHRVIQHSGALGNYRWGSARKRLMIGVEGALAA
ncbi:MAG TPA: methylated-DNA--[protein]-cysteine S-methyltransferase [Candidatus Sulfotelmatobacter sp.]|nr:methylated-DNA--[protein]-cysteine S-methyltransferase [Candidatus Sulfotelmatobacter sp.]